MQLPSDFYASRDCLGLLLANGFSKNLFNHLNQADVKRYFNHLLENNISVFQNHYDDMKGREYIADLVGAELFKNFSTESVLGDSWIVYLWPYVNISETDDDTMNDYVNFTVRYFYLLSFKSLHKLFVEKLLERVISLTALEALDTSGLEEKNLGNLHTMIKSLKT